MTSVSEEVVCYWFFKATISGLARVEASFGTVPGVSFFHPDMSTAEEIVTADQPTCFPHTRAEALRAWEEFRPRVAAYADARNGVRPGHQAVSRLSPAIRRRLVTEYELIASTLEKQPFWRVEKFVQEMMWRRYWKSWLELRPAVWSDYLTDVTRLRGELRGYQAKRVKEIEAGHSGVEIMDYFADELRTTGYLHNHARMWFAGWWIHTEKLPWQLGADFFYRHLLDADPAANTLSWRWVAGLQTQGKTYLTRRSNLEKYVEPALLAAHAGGLDQLEDKLAHAVRVQESGIYRAEVPADASDTALPDDLPARTGLWVHADDLNPESAVPLAGQSFQSVFAGLDANILQAEGLSLQRQEHLRAGLADAATRAGEHFQAPVQRGEDAPLPEALIAWAKARDLQAVIALRPAVGPLHTLTTVVRERLAKANIALHLVWRPEDAETLPFAQAGYFAFWQGARAQLLGWESEPAADPTEKPQGKGKGKRRGNRHE